MNITITLVEETCVNCGTHYAVDSGLHQQFKSYGNIFYCPNGHGQSYTDTEVMRLKKEKENLAKRLTWAEQEANRQTMEADAAKREKKALKGQLTRTRNRIANGVCPCCHRTFKQLAAHMSNKHPDFKKVVSTTPGESA